MKLSRITWIPKYSVAVEAIDAQHRKLFDTMNHLLDVFESDSGDPFPVIKELVDYLSIHFHAEHMVMAEARYPDFAGHMQEHKKFTTRTEQFLKGYKEQNQEVTFDMVVFLRDWVFGHTCGIDQGYGDYLRKHASTTQKAAADSLAAKKNP